MGESVVEIRRMSIKSFHLVLCIEETLALREFWGRLPVPPRFIGARIETFVFVHWRKVSGSNRWPFFIICDQYPAQIQSVGGLSKVR